MNAQTRQDNAQPAEFADLEIRVYQGRKAGYPVDLTLDDRQVFTGGYFRPADLQWVPSADPLQDGQCFGDWFLADTQLRRAWDQVRGQARRCRVRLRLDDPALEALPWELLRDGEHTLAADADTPFSRYLAEPWSPPPPITRRPLKLLLAIASPTNLDEYGLEPIDPAQESALLEAALADLVPDQIELTVLPQPLTLSALEEALAQGYHLLHLVAHGQLGRKGDRTQPTPALFLADDHNQVARVDDAELAALLQRQAQRPHLIFLAACHSAARSPADAFRGFAPALLRAGVPAVLAMQDAVSVETARAFSQTFYRRLLQHGLVDLASNQARANLITANLPGPQLPILFSRLLDNQLITTRRSLAPLIPWQHPPRAEHQHFLGRQAELDRLLADLQPGQMVTLCGPGGIGKTALADALIRTLEETGQLLQRFPDGVLFHTFYGQPDPALAFQHLVRSYNPQAQDTSATAARGLLAHKRALIVFDGTEAATRDDLAAVLNVTGHCAVLITTRRRSDAPTADRLDLAPLPQDEAITLLRTWAAAQIDRETVGQICVQLGRLPLAVRLAGRYLSETAETPTEYLAWLQKSPLEALDQGRRRLKSVPILLQHSLDQVDPQARQLLALLGLLALAPFQPWILASALELDETTLRRPLAQLVNFGLLTRLPTPPPDSHTPDSADTSPPSGGSGGPYAVTHALIHTYARERLAVDDDTAGRLVARYTELAKTESEKGRPGYRRLDPERPHLLRLIAACTERGHWVGAKGLVWAVDGYLTIQGHTIQRQQATQAGLTATRQLADRRGEGALLGNLGITYANLGQFDRAVDFFQQALAISREIDDRRAQGEDLGNLGLAYCHLGQLDQAVDFLQQALAILRQFGGRRGEGALLGNLGIAYAELGQVEQAIDYYKQALVIARETNDRHNEGSQLGNLGSAYADLGQFELAIDFHQQALAISREIGDRHTEGSQLGNLGLAYHRLGQFELAIDFYQQALAIHCQISDRRGEGSHLGKLGLAHADLGQVDQAIDHYQQALHIAQEIGDRPGEARHSWNLGLLYEEGDPARAVALMSPLVEYEREIGHPDAEAHAEDVAQIQARLGND